MKKQLLSVVLLITLLPLTPGASRGSDWLLMLTDPPMDPAFCAAQGKNCGLIDDGKGGKVDCGPCTGFKTCGGGGHPNICGCTAKDCTGVQCGTIDRGCGLGPLTCDDNCSGTDTCGGGGKPNVCGCTPKTCAGRNCGLIDPGCGRPMLSCGQCSAGNTCGGGGTPGVCGSCIPQQCGSRRCGSIERGCGLGSVSCGECRNDQSCVDGACRTDHPPPPPKCPCGGHWPNACEICPIGFLTTEPAKDPALCKARKKNCGEIDDGHGGQVSCGTCKGKNTCGGGGVPNVCGRPRKQ